MAPPIPQSPSRSRANVAYSIWWNKRLHPVNQQRQHEHLSMLRQARREQWERRYPGPFEDDDNDSVFDVEDWPLPPLTSPAQTDPLPQASMPAAVAPSPLVRPGDNPSKWKNCRTSGWVG
ncbi:hypothetical protein BDZ45DRAFT_489425 [Acephala macrosclerotiorum]|nr:hypothetical protein BDZ45DRAFT_489425 [Acephala macrosclerotiorum]